MHIIYLSHHQLLIGLYEKKQIVINRCSIFITYVKPIINVNKLLT